MMSGTTIDSSLMTFDPCATSFDNSKLQAYYDVSPAFIFDTEDFSADFTSDSAASPLSPLSPALSATSLGFSTTEAWAAWDAVELSPEFDHLFGCQTFASRSPSNPSLSPAINPIDLTAPAPADFLPEPPQVMPRLVTTPSQQHQDSIRTTAADPTLSTTAPTNDAAAERYPSRILKRKFSSGLSKEEPGPKSTATVPVQRPSTSKQKVRQAIALGPKKSAHNMIEKRYRTNLNDKITQLRDAVPSLRLLAQRAKNAAEGGSATRAELEDDDDDAAAVAEDGGLIRETTCSTSGLKLNKATILSKATEYIRQLERRNQGLEAENGALRGRMEGLEMILMSHGGVLGGWN